MPEDKLTEEEKKAQKETEDLFRVATDKFLSKVYSILSWCWPATIAMFIGREVLRLFGYYGISNWAVTVFLWLPFAIVAGVTVGFIGIFYIVSLLTAWREFVAKILLWFAAGFKNGGASFSSSKENNGESNDEHIQG